ncbi:hypothetical protein NC653_041606 [Populus alba x Populus x berolinensis]|uniref:Uncharacterized protein n=1 Tax=Populus alba x Populus x berolinensis TaxID=444605 RepID=A0AAD6LBC8_9ROSI|nr:hypothetical protein NC653_041606 [Populus alba x Populus x berolinensis]
MATEDFTFPISTDPVSCSIDSPPLWCLSPDPYHEETSKESSTEGEERDQDEQVFKHSFPTEPIKHLTEELGSAAISELVRIRNGGLNDKEEKMDMLWEDFNTEETSTRSHSSSGLDSEAVHTGCVKALRLSKPGLVVFMKVLKSLFLIHNSHRSVMHHSSYRPSVRGHWSHKPVKIGSWY